MILPSSQISSIAQRKSGGPIPDVNLSLATHRSLDRNQLELFFLLSFYFPPFHKYCGIHFLIYKPSKRPRLESICHS